MDFGTDERTERLRGEVRTFVREHLTADVRTRVASSGNYHDAPFHEALARQGWICTHWAQNEGGRGWDRAHTDVIYEELATAGAPVEGLAVTQIVGEAIRRLGSPDQKRRFLEPVCRGEILFALGYTEPGSGSDLASVQTRAARDGDGWVIDGQKIFTTLGNVADYVFLLTRTDPEAPKHEGLTLFLVPTDSDGFTAAPIFTLSGERTNVTYYAGVRVGDDARVGEPGQGWEILNVALAFERGGEFAAQLRRLVEAGAAFGRSSGRARDPRYLGRLGRVAAAAEVARVLGHQASWSRKAAKAGAVEGAIAKVYGTEALLSGSGSLLDAAGAAGVRNPDPEDVTAAGELQHLYRESQIATIYGGTSEVLRSVIAQQRLRLPRARRPAR